MPFSLSASIVVYDLDSHLLQQVLASLASAVSHAKGSRLIEAFSLTVVDNGDSGSSIQSLLPPEASLIQNLSNVGYGAAHNQAIRKTNSDIHLVLNPDVILDEGSISETLSIFQKEPSVVACGPLGTDESGRNLYLSKRYPSILDLFLRGFAPAFVSNAFRRRLDHYEYRDLEQNAPSEVTLLSGCCLFARTVALQKTGGFDETFFLYFEDYDLCLRLSDLGQVTFVPSAQIIHHGGNSAKKGSKHIQMFIKSAIQFFQKNGWRFI